MGKIPNILKTDYHTAGFYKEFWDILKSCQSWEGEFYNRKKKWRILLGKCDHFTCKNEKDEITHFVAIKTDITESKRINTELLIAKKKAEESDRLKSAFLANMSHEIRTPLNSIIGFSDLLADPNFGPEQKADFVQLINEQGNNLLTVISDIMDFSKIEAGQIKLKKSNFSVIKLITSLQKELSFTANKKGLEIVLDPLDSKEEIMIHSDIERIRQIMNNLLSNAIKFTEMGFIEIGFKNTDDFVQFHVKDTGNFSLKKEICTSNFQIE